MTYSQHTSYFQRLNATNLLSEGDTQSKVQTHSLFTCCLTAVGQALSAIQQREITLGYAQQTANSSAQTLGFEVASLQMFATGETHTEKTWKTLCDVTQQQLVAGLESPSETTPVLDVFVGAEVGQALPNIVEHPLLPQQGQHPLTVYFRQLDDRLTVTTTVDNQQIPAHTYHAFARKLRECLLQAKIAVPLSKIDGPYLPQTFEQLTLNARLASVFRTHAKQLCLRREGQQLTYQQLWQQADALASSLLHTGFATLAVGCQRKVNSVLGILAAMILGKPFVIVEPQDQNKRRKHILSSVPYPLLIDDGHIEQTCSNTLPAENIVKDDHFIESILFAQTDPDACICYTFTSGTTGKPKGIAIKQIALLNVILTRHALVNIQSSDVMLHNISFSFDPALWQLFGAIGFGAGVLLQDDAEVLDSQLTLQLMQQTTMTDFVPSVLNKLLDSLPNDATFPRLRVLYVGGEVFTPALFTKLQPRANALIFNQYGPSECSIDSLAQEITALAAGQPIAIGTPIANSTSVIVDDENRIVAQGEVGELLIGGLNVSDGYLDTSLNTQAFCDIDGERFYRSGDLCVLDAFGHIGFKGRKDRQVKLNGIRVELEDLETRLTQLSEISAAFATFQQDNVTFYILLTDLQQADTFADNLRLQCVDVLPRCAATAQFRLLREVPHNSSGKPDVSRFDACCMTKQASCLVDESHDATTHIQPKQPDTSSPKTAQAPQLSAALTTPLSPSQPDVAAVDEVLPESLLEQCQQVFADLLKASFIEQDDDFFRLGGSSLQVIDLVLAVKKQFAVEVPVPALMAKPTAANLAKLVYACQQSANSDSSRATANLDSLANQSQITLANSQQSTKAAEYALSPEMRLLANEAPLTSHVHWLFFALQNNSTQADRNDVIQHLLKKAQQIDALRLHLQRKGGELGLRDSGDICHINVNISGVEAAKSASFAQLNKDCQQGNLPLFALVQASDCIAIYIHRGLFDGYCASLLQQAFTEEAQPAQLNGFTDYIQRQNQTTLIAEQKRAAEQFVQQNLQVLRDKRQQNAELHLPNDYTVNNLPEALSLLWSLHVGEHSSTGNIPPLYVGVLATNRHEHSDLQAIGRYVNVVPLLLQNAQDIDTAIQQVVEWQTPYYHIQAELRGRALSQLKFDVIINQHFDSPTKRLDETWESYSSGQELAHLGKAIMEI